MTSVKKSIWNFKKKGMTWSIMFFVLGVTLCYYFIMISTVTFYHLDLLKVDTSKWSDLDRLYGLAIFDIFPFGFGVALANFATNTIIGFLNYTTSKESGK